METNKEAASNATNDMALIAVMAAVGAKALQQSNHLRSHEDEFTTTELEEMLAISVCNNIDKEDM